MTTTTLQRLLRYPHAAVFDKAPAAQLAFRLTHPDGAVWRVAGEILTVTAGQLVRSYALRPLTFSALIAALEADGFAVANLQSALASRSAAMLAEGEGDERQSNGDHLYTFTSLLWVMLSGYAVELSDAQGNLQQALRQMVLGQAEDIWLDLWGALYDQQRIAGESDALYAPRIQREAFRLRVNAFAIEKAVLDATGYEITIEEPWKNIFTLDESTLSGEHRMYDGYRTGYHIIQPTARRGVDWAVIMPVIHRNRAAGITVIDPSTQLGDAVDASGTVIFRFARFPLYLREDRYLDRALLDYSAIEDTSIVNEPFVREQNILHFGEAVVPTKTWAEYPGKWPDVTWRDTVYLADFIHGRDYRVFYSAIIYEGQHWPDKKWSELPAGTWRDFNVVVSTAHSTS